MKTSLNKAILSIVWLFLLGACSTTRRIPEGEVLYTGVKHLRILPDSGVVLSTAAEDAAREPLSVAPNNPLYTPYVRTPLPIGLWAWNYCYSPREKGFKYWFYKRLAKEPVLISKVQPGVRSQVAVQALENFGYFGSRVMDSLRYRKKGRKAKIDYTLHIAPPWFYGSISYPQVNGPMSTLVDSLRATSLLRTGAQYNLDTLSAEQQRIAAYLDEKCARIDALLAEKDELLDKLAEYKKSLIFECVTGKREVAA